MAINQEQVAHYADKLQYETDSWDLSMMIEADEALTLIDARSPQAYAHEHIPGAINIPHRSMTPEAAAQIPTGSLVVTYCDGIGCNASTKGALNMSRLGFQVKELIGGLDWWKQDGHPTAGESVKSGR